MSLFLSFPYKIEVIIITLPNRFVMKIRWTRMIVMSSRSVWLRASVLQVKVVIIDIIIALHALKETAMDGMNVCALPKFICWSPNPQCDSIWRWSLWKVIRFRGHKGEPLVMGLVPL